ncbi:hypothetical protein [Streptomyces sp. NPDC057675]|uniref:hypothetical protein n=1 Tax=Streptomyces sp. NPDC057675 TaxID=3346204 RepID=UPI00369F7A42
MEADVEASRRAAAAERDRQEQERRRQAAAQRALQRQAELLERQAELQRLAGFFEYAGLDATVGETFTQMLRSASGQAIVYGDQSPSHGNGLLVYARQRWASEKFKLAGVVCPHPEALSRWPMYLTILVPNQTWLAHIQTRARSPLKVAVLNRATGRSAFIRVSPSRDAARVRSLP